MAAVPLPSNVRVFPAREQTPLMSGVAVSATPSGDNVAERVVAQAPTVVASRIVPVSRVKGFSFSRPLYVVVDETDEGIAVSSYDLDISELGDDESEALEAFRVAVGELTDVLLRDNGPMSSYLLDQKRFLTSLL